MLILLLECARSKAIVHIKLNKTIIINNKMEMLYVIKIFSNFVVANVKYLENMWWVNTTDIVQEKIMWVGRLTFISPFLLGVNIITNIENKY